MTSKNFDKVIDEICGYTVLELSEFVKALREKTGISDVMPMMAAAPAAAAAPVKEEKTHYKVTLVEGGSKKVDAIKALRQAVPTLNLIDAKKAVEGAPTVIAESAPKEDADKMKKLLEEAGAKVELA